MQALSSYLGGTAGQQGTVGMTGAEGATYGIPSGALSGGTPGALQSGLLGPSGMGKTTLFRVLAGLDVPDRGTVLLGEDGRPVERGMVGVVAQNYPLFEHRTVLGNLVVAGRTARLLEP